MNSGTTYPLRVLIATPEGRGGQGGIDRIMENLADILARRNREISVELVATRGSGGAINMIPAMLRFLSKLLLEKAAGSPNLVHINVSQRGSIRRKAIIAAVCRLLRIPHVIHVHGSQFHHSWENGGDAMRVRIRRMLDGAGRIMVLGNFWSDFLIGIGAAPERIRIVPNATAHPAEANAPRGEDVPRILFLGRLGERKGVPQLLDAFVQLTERGVGGWHATLAGDGDTETYRSQTESLGLTDKIDITGWVGPDGVRSLLSTHDILVLPSFNENLPMSVIEGMAYGMAVVSTPVGAVNDILETEVSGLLVPPGDVPALTEALQRCIVDPALRERLGTNARAFHAAHLDLEGYGERVLAVWREAIDETRRR